ncbi:MAG TPA: AzlC family ABC transporter permease [Burkholderiales bacterium]|jgi:predicted branched-subunit amino acid permease|nr:AzlC family ABC transporter permease [Burkholderiales bacterium]
MSFQRPIFAEGVRASLPVLLGVVPFGVITGVAMVASGIPPLLAILMSLLVFAGASMVASAQLLASNTPVLLVVLTTLIINLRFMMYSASLRLHFAHAPLRWRLLLGYLTADNVYGLMLQRFSDRPDEPGRLEYFLGAGICIWLVWQIAVLGGVLIGAGVPASWRLEFAAPLAFIAMTIPLLRDRAMTGAALAAGITVIAAHALPLKLSVLAAAAVGIGAGMLLEPKTR